MSSGRTGEPDRRVSGAQKSLSLCSEPVGGLTRSFHQCTEHFATGSLARRLADDAHGSQSLTSIQIHRGNYFPMTSLPILFVRGEVIMIFLFSGETRMGMGL